MHCARHRFILLVWQNKHSPPPCCIWLWKDVTQILKCKINGLPLFWEHGGYFLCIEHHLEMCFVLLCLLLHPTQVEEDSHHPKWLSDGAVIVPRLHSSTELSLAQALERGVFDCKMNCVKFTWLPAAPGSLLEPGAWLYSSACRKLGWVKMGFPPSR